LNSTVLLCHRSPTREWYPDVWDLPGGHIELGETGGEALRRELAEELGIAVDLEEEPLTRIVDESIAIELCVWLIDQWKGELSNLAPNEHDELRWCSLEDAESLDLAHPSYFQLMAEALPVG
jgi:mutator protein MutT